jgi:hypothetical protein
VPTVAPHLSKANNEAEADQKLVALVESTRELFLTVMPTTPRNLENSFDQLRNMRQVIYESIGRRIQLSTCATPSDRACVEF